MLHAARAAVDTSPVIACFTSTSFRQLVNVVNHISVHFAIVFRSFPIQITDDSFHVFTRERLPPNGTRLYPPAPFGAYQSALRRAGPHEGHLLSRMCLES